MLCVTLADAQFIDTSLVNVDLNVFHFARSVVRCFYLSGSCVFSIYIFISINMFAYMMRIRISFSFVYMSINMC